MLCVELIQHRTRCIYGDRMGNCDKTIALFFGRCHIGIRLWGTEETAIWQDYLYSSDIKYVKRVDVGCRSVTSFRSWGDFFFLLLFQSSSQTLQVLLTIKLHATEMFISRSGVLGIDPIKKKNFSDCLSVLCYDVYSLLLLLLCRIWIIIILCILCSIYGGMNTNPK